MSTPPRSECAATRGEPHESGTVMTFDRSLKVPYRVCILGEHVDHQGGRTLSANLDLGVVFEYRAEPEGSVFVEAADFGEAWSAWPGAPLLRKGSWSDYLKGILQQLMAREMLGTGLRGRIRGEFASGGLSSSAAVQIAYALALLDVNDVRMSRLDVARLVMAAERSFCGVQVGALDPMTILFADGTDLLALDCKGLGHEAVSWPEGGGGAPRFAVIHSGIERVLTDSPYNDRTRECREAARALDPSAAVLGDVPSDRRRLDRLPPIGLRRAQHFYEELDRVERGAEAWRAGDIEALGREIDACGDSCVRNFDLGTPELDDLVGWLRAAPGVLGARFTGGGFGGAVFALLEPGDGDPITPIIEGVYAENHPDAASRARVAYPGLGPPADHERRILLD